jgi:hypothetical protein
VHYPVGQKKQLRHSDVAMKTGSSASSELLEEFEFHVRKAPCQVFNRFAKDIQIGRRHIAVVILADWLPDGLKGNYLHHNGA